LKTFRDRVSSRDSTAAEIQYTRRKPAMDIASPTRSDQVALAAGDPYAGRRALGRAIIWLGTAVLVIVTAIQILDSVGVIGFGFENWRPVLYAYLIFAVLLGWGQVLSRGEQGLQALFILPASLFTAAVVIFPTLFGFSIAFTNWNLSSSTGRQFNGLDNLVTMFSDSYYGNALLNTVYYVLAVLVEYAIAFGLALLLNADIRGRRFFRVSFLMPFMLSPVAVSWMVGKSLMETRFGPIANLMRWLGWDNPAFFSSPWIARASIEIMDAWVWIPFIIVLMLAGLQAMPKDISEAAEVDGATGWQKFWKITFPLMLPISVTAVVLRIIFKLKLADLVINVTYGGPGGATDTVTTYIFRVYRDRSNVGYGTMLAMVYLVIIIVFVAALLNFVSKRMQKIS
jgi:multiple sugar transport system permease protein